MNTTFGVEGKLRHGYLALPSSGHGRAVLVLHAWWGLTPFFQRLCDRLAGEGFVAFAPDLHHGKLATTAAEAEQILAERDFPATQATALAALDFLRHQPAVRNRHIGALGFSMGASFALLLQSLHPKALAAIVLFYGASGANLAETQTQFLGHYGGTDPCSSAAERQTMTADNVTLHTYNGVGHWFFEDDRPEHYNPEAAQLAWQRTVTFLCAELPE